MSQAPLPSEIQLHKHSRKLELVYGDEHYLLSAEFLRVHSPSAEVQGHGPGQEVLQVQKEKVGISNIEPVGHYAIKIYFDDGHDSGLFSWEYILASSKFLLRKKPGMLPKYFIRWPVDTT